MDWIFENFQVVVAIVVIGIWILRSVVGANKPEEQSPPRTRAPAEDPAEAERTRQIQEEIRRRILARQRGETLVTPPPMPPVVTEHETSFEEPEVMEEEYLEEGPRTPMPSAAAHRQADAAQTAILEQQRLLAEQFHALRAARAAGGSVSPLAALSLSRDAAATIAAHQLSCRRELRRDLRHPTSLRRAILLKEILGEPLALQRGRQLPRR